MKKAAIDPAASQEGAGGDPVAPPSGPSRSEELAAEWREYFLRAHESPPHPAARDFLNADLAAALRRLIPSDARVLEVGCGWGDLVASLPQAIRAGVDFLPENVGEARRRHPDLTFEVDDVLRPSATGADVGSGGSL